MFKIAKYILGAGLILSTTAASADGVPQVIIDDVIDACRADYDRFDCSYYSSNPLRCLRGYDALLTPSCRKKFKLAYTIEACLADYRHFCNGTPKSPEDLKCLAGKIELLNWECYPALTGATKAQVSVKKKLGDPALGLVATVLVMPLDQPNIAPQGKVWIHASTKNPSRSRDLYLDFMAKSDAEPPRRRFTRFEIALDGKAYQTVGIHPWGAPDYGAALPYTPKTLSVAAYTSLGARFDGSVEVPIDLRLDRSIDLRSQEVERPSDAYTRQDIRADTSGDIAPPYRDQTGFRVYEYSEGGRGLTIATTCLGSKTAGRIVHSRLVLKQHYFYTPAGDLVLSDTTYHQPVYGTDESVTLNSPLHDPERSGRPKPMRFRRADDRANDPQNPYPAQFVLECRTDKDRVLRREFGYRYRLRDWPPR